MRLDLKLFGRYRQFFQFLLRTPNLRVISTGRVRPPHRFYSYFEHLIQFSNVWRFLFALFTISLSLKRSPHLTAIVAFLFLQIPVIIALEAFRQRTIFLFLTRNLQICFAPLLIKTVNRRRCFSPRKK